MNAERLPLPLAYALLLEDPLLEEQTGAEAPAGPSLFRWDTGSSTR